MNTEWYKDWFSSEYYLDVYKHRNFDDTESLVHLILSNTEIISNAKVLDAACGAGRYSIRFAENGFQVTGFDLSLSLLDIAKSEAENRNLNIDFINADLRNFKIEKKFDLILSLFTSFGYFNTDVENFTFPKNSYKMLKEKGYYILDYLNKDYVVNNLVENNIKIIDNKEIEENRFIENGRVIKKIMIKNGSENQEYLESVKLYDSNELLEGFSNIGYKSLKIFGDYKGSDFNNLESERCIIIFQK